MADTAGMSTPNKRTTAPVDSAILKAIPKCEIASGNQISQEKMKASKKKRNGDTEVVRWRGIDLLGE